MNMTLDNDKTLAALAAAMVQQPRGTIQDWATAIGVGRATLFRFCKTRDELLLRLFLHASERLGEGVEKARLQEGPPREALSRLIESHVEHKELMAFMLQFWDVEAERHPLLAERWRAHEAALDAFFLRGQKEGAFRIDITASTLNDTVIWLIIGLMDSESRGRIARASLKTTIEQLFLTGAAVR
ncbi:TetR/AcrR family transcriptional regulator [Variovorax sp. HJSM1_2]|uniref:TetR/AcrR family transcriptional regulator n=1 Tax=Variovorax sp. HJSM1_2 TaxID=3366263 RepID=UPI003BEB1AE4